MRIRALRLQRKLTQEELAHAAGITAKMLSYIECAHTNPSFATLVGISRALGVKLSKLLE